MPRSPQLPNRPARAAVLTLAATAAVATAVATAQLRFGRFPLVSPGAQPHDDKDAPVGVTVPDSPGALERLDHAAEKQQQQQWKVAAEYYREAVAQFPGRVVPASADHAGGTYRYTGVAAAVQERLAKWPPAGLAVYRNLYGPAAADKLAAAGRGDLAALESIFYDDFVTDAGKGAGVRLIDAYAEAGDFPAAADVGRRLLDLHPTLGGDRPAILIRTALVCHWGGDDAAADKWLADLRQSDPKAVGTVGGKDVVLADALAVALAVPAPAPAVDAMAADTYPSFGGPGGRGDVSPSTAKPGASLNTIALTPPDLSSIPVGPARVTWQQQDQASLVAGGAGGTMPVVDAGTLFFQDGRTLYAVDADSGMPVTGWLNTYPGDAGGRYHLPAAGRARGELLTVTVTPTAVLAVMGQRDRALFNGGMFNGNLPQPQADDGTTSPLRLVCLDRSTGRELWKASPADLPDVAGAVKSAEYDGTPLSVPANVAGTPDDAVLVMARGGKDNQFDNAYVVCLSASTGQYRWSTYVGSGTRAFDGESGFGQDPSQLSLADGRAFVMTNLGTVAALDPADGRVLWLDAYNRDNAATLEDLQQQQLGGGMVGNRRPWARNPAIVQGGHVFALPTDAKSLMVLDAGTGRELKRVNLTGLAPTDPAQGSPPDVGTADVLLGIRAQPATSKQPAAELLVLSDNDYVYGLDWRTYDAKRPGVALRFAEPVGLDGEPGKPADQITGRGFLTADSILVTTRDKLHQIGWRHGFARTLATYPAAGDFQKTGGQGPGNILVTSQNVVVAGLTRVDVYTDLGVVTAKYDREMAAAPADPQPRVRFANALFAGGETADALARIDQAIDLLGGRSAMRPGAGRQMVFNTLLDFAHRLSQPVDPAQAADPKTVDLANGLFDRAADAADGPDQRVAYLLARARFDHDVSHDYAAEVELCQQVLADGALRRVAVTDEQTAAAAATTVIAAAVEMNHAAYGPVEARAAAALANAKDDPDALLAVAEVYPNSRAAAEAQQAAVDRYQASGQAAKAVDILRQMYAAAGDPLIKAGVLESIAADLLAAGPDGVGPAADRLARAAHLSPDPHLAADLKLPDGTVLRRGEATYADATAALRTTLAAADAARLPDFHLSTYPQAMAQYAALHNGDRAGAEQLSPFLPGATSIAGVTALIHPPREFDRTDRVVTWSPAGLAVYAVGQTTPLFRAAAVTDAPLGGAWVGGHEAAHCRWLVWTPTRLLGLTDDGHDAWPAPVAVADLSPAPAVATGGAVVDDTPPSPDVSDAQGGVVINGNIVNVQVNGNRRMFVIRGNRLVPAPVAPAAGPPVVLAAGEQITAAQPAGPTGDTVLLATSAGRVVAVDAGAGRVLWQSRPADRPADALLANAHFTVARLDDPSGATIVAYDTPTGRVIGRRRFAADNMPGQLVNVALGEEGTLAFTLTNSVEVKDLYDPWKQPPDLLTARANADVAPYTGMGQADQLLVRAGRVVTLYGGGQYVRAYDLSRRGDPTNPLSTGSSSPNVWLRLVGPQLFVVQPGNAKRYDLSDLQRSCGNMLSSTDNHIRGMLLGSDYVILVDDPVDRGPAGSPRLSVIAVNRQRVPGRDTESDEQEFFPYTVPSAPGIDDWLGVDGGMYFLTGDHKLHLKRGGRPG